MDLLKILKFQKFMIKFQKNYSVSPLTLPFEHYIRIIPRYCSCFNDE